MYPIISNSHRAQEKVSKVTWQKTLYQDCFGFEIPYNTEILRIYSASWLKSIVRGKTPHPPFFAHNKYVLAQF